MHITTFAGQYNVCFQSIYFKKGLTMKNYLLYFIYSLIASFGLFSIIPISFFIFGHCENAVLIFYGLLSTFIGLVLFFSLITTEKKTNINNLMKNYKEVVNILKKENYIVLNNIFENNFETLDRSVRKSFKFYGMVNVLNKKGYIEFLIRDPETDRLKVINRDPNADDIKIVKLF